MNHGIYHLLKIKLVMARLVPNTDDTTTNTLYIQGNGGVIANYNSSDLFYNFSKLTEIENINLLDTSNVTDNDSVCFN